MWEMHIYLLQIPLLDLYSLGRDAKGMKIKLNSGFEAQHFQLHRKWLHPNSAFFKAMLRALQCNFSFILPHHLEICPLFFLPVFIIKEGARMSSYNFKRCLWCLPPGF